MYQQQSKHFFQQSIPFLYITIRKKDRHFNADQTHLYNNIIFMQLSKCSFYFSDAYFLISLLVFAQQREYISAWF